MVKRDERFKTLYDAEEWLRNQDHTALGANLIEYVEESNFGDWDGFKSHDKTGIRRFLSDFAIYDEAKRKGGA